MDDLFGSSSAVLSDDGLYRYLLTRTWDIGPVVNFIMLNPSTADASQDDPTIRRCIAFTKRWGYAGLVVTNLYAYRSTDPAGLRAAPDPVGPANDNYLVAAAGGRFVVAAWGAHAEPARVAAVLNLIPGPIYSLGVTKGGQPRHPLYIPGATPATFYRHGDDDA